MTLKKSRPTGEKTTNSAVSSRGFRLRNIPIIALVLLLAVAALQVFSPATDHSDPSLRTSTADLRVYAEKGDLYFIPQKPDAASMGFVFYPGAKVPKEAYSYLARAVAQAGYPAVLVDLPLGFALFGVESAARPAAALPEVKTWVVGGHSLGGVAAALYARKHQDLVAGIVFLASYPPGGSSLANTKIRALSISASNDMLTTREKIAKSRPLLPESTRYLVIDGGNHAQFGDYGRQRGDGAAEIPPSLQQRETAESVSAFLASLR